jgi:hypothetical protein
MGMMDGNDIHLLDNLISQIENCSSAESLANLWLSIAASAHRKKLGRSPERPLSSSSPI